MAEKNQAVLVESDVFIREKLSGFLDQHLGADDYRFCDPNDTPENAIVLSGQIRAGVVLDRLFASSRGASSIHIGDYVLDAAQGVLKTTDDETIRLTEKEVALLEILYAAGGHSVSRETLLDQVWEYADSVETHTLETHIYRLRQKIELDPTNPALLVTDDEGYCLRL